MKRKFEIDLPKGTHLGQVKGANGLQRGMIFDKNNKLVGQAVLKPVDSSGSLIKQGLGVAAAISAISFAANRYAKKQAEVENERFQNDLSYQREEAEIEKDRLNNRLRVQREFIELEEERQQNQIEFEKQQMAIEQAAHDEKRRMRFENLMDELEEEYLLSEDDVEYEVVVAEEEIEPDGFLKYVDVVLDKCSAGIASEEAQEKLVEVIGLSRTLALKIKEYAQICVNNGEQIPDSYFMWQKAIEKLVTGKVVESLRAITSLDRFSIEQRQTINHLLDYEQSELPYEVLCRQIDERKLGAYLFVEVSQEQERELRYCSRCGSKVNSKDSFCMNCGAPL